MWMGLWLQTLLNTAQALDCDFRPPHTPFGEQSNMPLNLRPFVYDQSPDAFWALRVEDALVSEDVEWLELGPNAFQMIPEVNLTPNTDYQLIDVNTPNQVHAYLSTGEFVDDTAPEIVEILDVYRETGTSEWGDTDHLILDIQLADVDVAYAKVEFAVTDNMVAPIETWVILYATSDVVPLVVGQGLCSTSASPDTLDNNPFVRLTFYDWAGNASENLLVDTEYEQSLRKRVGCSSVEPMSLLLFGWGLLGCRTRER